MKKILFILLALFWIVSLSYAQVTWGSIGKIRWDMLDEEVPDSMLTWIEEMYADSIVSDSLSLLFAADTNAIKLIDAPLGRTCLLRQLSSANVRGNGLLKVIDSLYKESIVAFSHPTAGKQWVRIEYLESGIINIEWAGAIPGDGICDAFEVLDAVDEAYALGSDVVEVPPTGEFTIEDTTVWLQDNSTIFGAGMHVSGFAGDSCFIFFRSASKSNITLSDFYISSTPYPNDTTMTYDGDYWGSTAIFMRGGKNIRIERLKITGTTTYGIYFGSNGADNIKNVKIEGCLLENAGYAVSVIAITSANAFSYDSTDAQNFKVINNTIIEGGQQKIIAPGTTHDRPVSAIQLVSVRNVSISNNDIYRPGAFGVRIEVSEMVTCSGNIIEDAGEAGIFLYTFARHCTVMGNTIHKFGRLPLMHYIRKDSADNHLITRSYLSDVDNSLDLPRTIMADDSGWIDFPYVITGETDSIPTWDTTGITYFNPFRGWAGIQTSGGFSYNNVIIGNTIIGDTTTTGDLYNYASDYGIAVNFHPVNQYTKVSGPNTIMGNSVYTVINSDRQIYAPQHTDSIVALDYANGTQTRSTIFGNPATVWDWAISDVLAHGLASQSNIQNNLRVLENDFESMNAVENKVDQIGAYIGLDPWIFADHFNASDTDSLIDPTHSDIDSTWVTSTGTFGIKDRKATSHDGANAFTTIAISDSDYVMELDIENFTSLQGRVLLKWLDVDNHIYFYSNGDSTYRLQEKESGVVTTFASENGKALVTDDDHFVLEANDTTYTVTIQNNLIGTRTFITGTNSFLSNNTRVGMQCSDSTLTFDNFIIKPYEE